MGAITHFLLGMLCGAAIGGVAVAFRRRLVVWLPPFILACGFWAEAPSLAGARDASQGLANVFFGYAWLHPWLVGDEMVSFFFILGLANLLVLGYVVFLARFFAATDMIRWEREDPPRERTRSLRSRSRRSRSRR